MNQLEELSQRVASILPTNTESENTRTHAPRAGQTNDEGVQEFERRRANETKLILTGCDLSEKSKEDLNTLFQTELGINTQNYILSFHVPKANKRMMFICF